MAFCASVRACVCRARGSEMAHWLFRQKNTSGAWKTPAKFIASWQSPWDDAPSPKYTSVTLSSPLLRLAQASPTAWGTWLAIGMQSGRSRRPSGTRIPSAYPA